jgi:hypothetical protein
MSKRILKWMWAREREVTADDWQELESLVDDGRTPRQGETVKGWLSEDGNSEYDFVSREWKRRRE